jgi:hypothetical protein
MKLCMNIMPPKPPHFRTFPYPVNHNINMVVVQTYVVGATPLPINKESKSFAR